MQLKLKKCLATSLATVLLVSNISTTYSYQGVSTLPYDMTSGSGLVPTVTLPFDTTDYQSNKIASVSIDDAIAKSLDYYSNNNHNVLTDYADTLAILSVNNSLNGYTLPDITSLDESSGKISALSTRIILLNAMGLDPRNTMDGRNLVDELASLQNDKGEFRGEYPSISQHMFAMIALYNSNAIYDVDKAIDVLYNYYKGSVYDYGAEKRPNSFGDCDTTGFALIALAPYKDLPKGQDLITGCINFLKNEQLEDGGFAYDSKSQWFTGNSNSNSTATVISGLIAIGEDIDTWVKNEKTPIDALLTFQNDDGSFVYEQGYASDTFSFNQSLMALGDYKNNECVYNTIHSDDYVVTKEDLKNEIDATEEIDFELYTDESVSNVKVNLDKAKEVYSDPNASENDIYLAISLLRYSVIDLEKEDVISPDNKIYVNEEIVTSAGDVILSYGTYNIDKNSTVFDLLEDSLNQNNIPFEYRGSGNSIYISKIGDYEEFGHGVNSGFEYYVNGDKKSTSCASTVLNEGDVVKWVYTTDYTDQVVGPNQIINIDKTIVNNIDTNYEKISSQLDLTDVNYIIENIFNNYIQKAELSNFEQMFMKFYSGDNNEAIINSINSSLKDEYRKPTDLARVCLTLQIYDQDIKDFNGRNLYSELKNYNGLGKQGINGYIYTLFVSTNEGDEDFSKELVTNILEYQNDDGGFGLDLDNESDIDITAMAIQSLSPYIEIQEVNNSVYGGLIYIENNIDNELSCETLAQIIVALTMLNIDINDEHFTTNKNLLDRLLDYKYDDISFYHTTEEMYSDDISTEQAGLALISIKNNYKDIGVEQSLVNDKYLTRQNFLIEFAKYTNIEINYSLDNAFSDLPDDAITTYIINTWYDMGIVKGVENNKDLYFNPNDLITKEECSIFFARYFEMPVAYRNVVVNDQQRISSYAKDSVEEIVCAFGTDILDVNGNFNPNTNVSVSDIQNKVGGISEL